MPNRPVITLRGSVRHQEGGGWEWTGIWAFGALPDDVHDDNNNVTEASAQTPQAAAAPLRRKKGKRKFSLKGARPFRYHFCEARDASKVVVPWTHTEKEVADNDTEQGERATSPLIVANSSCDARVLPVTKPDGNSSVNALEAVEATEIETPIAANGECSKKVDAPVDTRQHNGIKVMVTPADPSPRSLPLGHVNEKLPEKATRQSIDNGGAAAASTSVSSEPCRNAAAAVEEEESSSVITNSSSSYARPLPREAGVDCKSDLTATNLSNGTSMPHTENVGGADPLLDREQQQPPTLSSVDVIQHADEPDPTRSSQLPNGPLSTAISEIVTKDNDHTVYSGKNLDTPSINDVTFASLTPFVDASIKYPDVCPCGGSWKGYFENVQIRKDRKSSRVSETFFLFFNSNPHPNATSFYDLQGEAKGCTLESYDADSSKLMPEQMHVRGMGSNQFGTFEIIGSFDISSSILHCHRMYIFSTAEEAVVPSQLIPRAMGTKSKEEGHALDSNQEKRAYFTRKKLMKWQRYDASGGESETEKERHRVRRRKDLEGQISSNVAPSTVMSSSILPTAEISKQPRKVDPTVPRKRSLSIKVSVIGPQVYGEENPPFITASKKNRQDQGISTSDVMVLPPVPDHHSFRWKAAHIFSSTKICDDPNGYPSVNINGNEAAPDRRFITIHNVYEGVCKGGKIREGLGVCLYENGNIYEGWWHRNKEHGKGILMTGDRRYIIYDGDWERGRMNGKGIYYYSYNSDFVTRPPDVDDCINEAVVGPLRVQRGGGVYKGDFKENCRHGIGVYTLPDGSVYDGEWRDNIQNGRGIFRWVDGSYYDGQWKDGKRHGIGALKAADGFFYEGQWVHNSMEGRGWCLYPNGQRYEGALSKGKKEGRGTLQFPNGAVYEGRFKDDCIEGQGTMKIISNVATSKETVGDETTPDDLVDWMIPLQFQSDMSHIHQRAGFTKGGS